MMTAADTGGSGAPKRPRLEGDDEDEDFSAILSAKQVQQLIDEVIADKACILNFLGNEKLPEGKKKVKECVTSFSKAIMKISGAFLAKLATENTASTCESAMMRACNSIEQAVEALAHKVESTTQTFHDTLHGAKCASAGHDRSYAGATARSRSAAMPTDKVVLQRGKSFNINKAERIIIGPLVDDASRYPTAKETKAALLASVNPATFSLKVNRVSYGPKNTVIVEADSLSADAFAKCPDLSKAGLGVRTEEKLNPRLIIHDIPVETTSDEIRKSLVHQNVPDASLESIKVIFLYSAREKKHRSCVIETTAPIRTKLLLNGKVCIGWSRCRIDDHVNILQCFKCHGFGHKAHECKSKLCCGICSGEHVVKDCSNRNSPKCVNCAAANLSGVSHAANDVAKCPILRRKIDRKISFIDYGS